MDMPGWDPDRPVPPDNGGSHTHTAGQIRVSVAKAGVENDQAPRGEWRVLLTMQAVQAVPAGHVLAVAMTFAAAMEIAGAIVQAAGDMGAGRVEEIS